jgi:glycosyltransferase involved in cell wall biosynthesis
VLPKEDMVAFGKFHICNTASRSGIASYAEDFFRIILGPGGFERLSPESVSREWMATLSEDSVFHVETGAGQFAERDVLIELVEQGFKNIDVTIHDPPWITFPFYRSSYPLISQVSKAFDWYFNTAGSIGRLLRRCRTVFVLSRRGKDLLEARHGLSNVCHIPFVIDPNSIWVTPPERECKHILYFGFVGPNKGLDYALALHDEVRRYRPGIKMFVIGEAMNPKALNYFESLKTKYRRGVSYLGFVPRSDLDAIFSSVAHVFLPFREYKYYCPCSASLLAALSRGRIVWTNPVNAVDEIVQDRINGRYLTGDTSKDAAEFLAMTDRPEDVRRVSLGALATCHKLQYELKESMQMGQRLRTTEE